MQVYKHYFLSFTVLIALLLLPKETKAERDRSSGLGNGVAIGVKAGTLGTGAEISIGSFGPFVLKAAGTYLPLKFEATITEVRYTVDPRLATASLLLELHPFANSFHICGGIIYNKNKLKLDARLPYNQQIGDYFFTPEQVGTLSGSVIFNEWAPYAGIGYASSFASQSKGWGFIFDLGIMFQGTPKVALSADGLLKDNDFFRYNLQKEEEDIQDEAKSFKLYPVINFGLSYTF
ncbi:MAG: hypothetical protein GX811_00170 [Lentisphaerae bacterium]|nr:hypothetical protein [Lentisphaerota bacterium]